LLKFRFITFFSHRYNLVEKITKVDKSSDIYNLSVENDNSYITEVAIVHNCRCIVRRLSSGQVTGAYVPEVVAPMFLNNPGITFKVFTKSHPYFHE
jgi:hypothetical protein